jgi:hypothetical protein
MDLFFVDSKREKKFVKLKLRFLSSIQQVNEIYIIYNIYVYSKIYVSNFWLVNIILMNARCVRDFT